MTNVLLAALLLLQQQQPAPRASVVSATTPPSRDTVGYWQQRVRYAIDATLDEAKGAVQARATLTYVNNSPDTLRELYVHQYLNAFRPGSKWSAADEREGRVRYQRMRDPAYAYERFTAAPTVDGVAVAPEYPGAPDSTVVRLALPHPLPPGDSLVATFAWEARPSTLPRRQGRRGRSFDFAQWFPKVAVYDRAGWEPRALVPAGEFYGEFGEYDVTLVVPEDQVIGATGVPVEGDPGWRRALRWGAVHSTSGAYGDVAHDVASSSSSSSFSPPPAGYKRVRFVARGVHHFAWSASPDYRYEGGAYVRPAGAAAMRFPTWDTVAINVLYRPGDERQWGNGQAVERTRRALRWLEHVYGPYGYPQMTNLHRIEGGGTEFPMMMMNGSASQGLILHEGGHVFTYGMLANNEWRSGWMDEGLTEYQTEWALGQTRPERAAGVVPLDSLVRGDSALAPPGGGPAPMSMQPRGYASLAARPPMSEQTALGEHRLDLLGRAEPIGTPGPEFNEFAIYNLMIYDRGAMMYGALRDAIGDEAFARFLRGYYARWAFRHVDEAAMRAEAERASGRDLGWFFDQWVHRTGLVDYALRSARIEHVSDGWVTRVRVERKGEYAHPVPVGVRSSAGWTIVRGDPLAREQTVAVRTAEKPVEVRLDPLRTTEDWYRPNDFHFRFLHGVPSGARPKYVVDWPFLEQSQGDRYLYAVAPMLTSSQPNGLLYGLRVRGNYQGLVDRQETGILFGSRSLGAYGFPLGPRDAYGDPAARLVTRSGKVQWWTTGSNPRLGPHGRPVIGLAYGLWNLDGITKVQLQRTWDTSPFLYAAGPRDSITLAFTGTYPYSRGITDPARWSGRSVSEARAAYGRRSARRATGPDVSFGVDATLALGYLGGTPAAPSDAEHVYARGELALSRTRRWAGGRDVQFLRGYAAYAEHAPPERAIYASASDPTTTFANHLWRPLGGPLAPSVPDHRVLARPAEYRTLADGHYLPLGGAALRGYDPVLVALGRVVAVNAEQAHRLRAFGAAGRGPALYGSLFGDAGVVGGAGGERVVGGAGGTSSRVVDDSFLADAGLGLSLRGMLFDRDVRVRADFPVYVRAVAPGVGGSGAPSDANVRFRFAFSFNDLW